MASADIRAALNVKHLREWIGRTDVGTDLLTPRVVAGLRATLDHNPGTPTTGDTAPLAAHWCLAPVTVALSETGADGHPRRGGFLPPVALPRRMWAGGELTFHDALRVGDVVERKSTIAEVDLKEGNSGLLCFVTVMHEISTPRGPAITERQDIVYREAPRVVGPRALPERTHEIPHATRDVPPATWHQEARVDAVALFRYSALTFNSHRIHYDRRYCLEEEGYPGLVVHGPLQATLLVCYAASIRDRAPAKFSFRAVSPMFDDAGCVVNAIESDDGLELWTSNTKGLQTMKAKASWR